MIYKTQGIRCPRLTEQKQVSPVAGGQLVAVALGKGARAIGSKTKAQSIQCEQGRWRQELGVHTSGAQQTGERTGHADREPSLMTYCLQALLQARKWT